MTNTYTQIPGELNIKVGYGDELALPIDFDISLTGYTFAANVVQEPTEEETAFIVSGTNLASGQIALYLSETQIQNIEEGKHKWYLIWTVNSQSRRALAGYFEIKKYP